jgi:2-polyprenyl-3-methyl-5-hydroxy-6-metoxy-1,4-benzoquinol methylase
MQASELAHHWDIKAADWDVQVGEQGDVNRRYNSDPVLWRLIGQVREQDVLDAGCGTGYLSRQLAQAGARVTGVDISSEMIRIAQAKAGAGLPIQFVIQNLATLTGLSDARFDAVVSNYVLMDLPDLDIALNLSPERLWNYRSGPCSVAFRLLKPKQD